MTRASLQAAQTGPASLRALLAGLVDYAGLYPPAELTMADAVAEYARQRASRDAWVLGRFVVAAARLDDFGAALEAETTADAAHWPLSVLLGTDPVADLATIERWEQRRRFGIDGLEFKAGSIAEIDRLVDLCGDRRDCYVEIPLSPDPSVLLRHLAGRGLRAKARTGGVTQELFPAVADVVRFFEICSHLSLPFKLTAGLHHPLAGTYRLTYQPDTTRGRMFGFITMFAAAAAIRQQWPVNQVAALVAEQAPSSLTFDDAGMHWQGRLLDTVALVGARGESAISFGSCSFEEPLTELRGLGYLPA